MRKTIAAITGVIMAGEVSGGAGITYGPDVFGPQGVHVVALIERARHLAPVEARALALARDAALGATLDAAGALVVRDLITTDHYDILTRPWRETIGPIHPDDPELATITREDK